MSAAKRTWLDWLKAGGGDPSRARGDAPRVALVTGCPRSGTTSVLNWLGAQKNVTAIDESRVLVAAHQFLDAVDRFATLSEKRQQVLQSLRAMVMKHMAERSSTGTEWLVEKEPLERIAFPDGRYDAFLRHARELLPDLHVVFMLREPVATVASMRARRWGYSLTSGETHEIDLDAAIDTWLAGAALAESLTSDSSTYLCRYDVLVTQPGVVSDEIAEFLGLRGHVSFLPRVARPLGLSADEQQHVHERTRDVWTRLGGSQ